MCFGIILMFSNQCHIGGGDDEDIYLNFVQLLVDLETIPLVKKCRLFFSCLHEVLPIRLTTEKPIVSKSWNESLQKLCWNPIWHKRSSGLQSLMWVSLK